jgi:methylated-DNA-[protein]-cysteine S-methyltransferase
LSENGQQALWKSAIVLASPNLPMPKIKSRNPGKAPLTHFYKTIDSPVGRLKLVANADGLAAVLWPDDDPRRVPLASLEEAPAHPTLVAAERQLQDYFAGRREKFSLRLAFRGTAFQRKVWTALTAIPFGETRSYAQIARQIGRPKAVRAVGAANGRNPLSIVAPCHRVVGADGRLTGFAGGLKTKAFLLRLERRHPSA